MGAGDGVKRIGRADQPQQLAGRAGSLRELLLSRRLFSTFSCRYSLAEGSRHGQGQPGGVRGFLELSSPCPLEVV